MPSLLQALALFSFLSSTSLALQVSPGSECASACLDDPEGNSLDPASSTTNVTDITCDDSSYLSTGLGSKFRNCINCLQTSAATSAATSGSPSENDVMWFLYNLRYTVDVCLYGFPSAQQEVSSPCDINYACQPLKAAMIADKLDGGNTTEYGYCDADSGAFMGTNLQPCIQCLQADSSQKYLANFLTALMAGCEQRPVAGTLLGLTGDLFSEAGVNITAPPESKSNNDNNGTGMTVGTIVGISVGAALLLLGGTALFIVYYRRQRDRRNHGDENFPPGTNPSSYYSAHKKSASFHSEFEPKTKFTGLGVGPHPLSSSFSTNAEYYDKLEEAVGAGLSYPPPSHSGSQGHIKIALDPRLGTLNPASALPAHPAYVPRATSRQSGRSSASPSPTPSATAVNYSTTGTMGPSTTQLSPPVVPKSNHKPSPLQNISTHTRSDSSYTLQMYLSSEADTGSIRIPPPPPNPATSTSVLSQAQATQVTTNTLPPMQSPPYSGRSVLSQQSQRSTLSTGAAKGTITSQGLGSNGAALSHPLPIGAIPPPPPGPPPSQGSTSPGRRIPRLSLPSVPRIKVPKKYSPPQIVVEGATPVDNSAQAQAQDQGPSEISGPLEGLPNVPRFGEASYDPARRREIQDGGRVIEHHVPLRSWRREEVVQIQSGKTQLYG